MRWHGQGGLPGKVTFESRPEGSEGASHANIWKKSLPSREKSECKVPEMNLRSREEASEAGASD